MRQTPSFPTTPNDHQSTARSLLIGSLEVTLEPAPEGTLVVRLLGREIRSKQAAELAYRLTEAALSCRGRMTVAMEGVSTVSAEWAQAVEDLSRRCEVMGGALVVKGVEACRGLAPAPVRAA